MMTTLKEALRKKTFTIMGIVTALYLVFWSILLYYFENEAHSHQMEKSFKAVASYMLTQMGLQFSSMLMALITIMLGAGAIAGELETGLIHAMMTRPIRRYEYILGKLCGLSILACAYATALFGLLLCISAAFGLSTVVSLSPFQIFASWLLYLLVPVAVLCLTLFGSVTFKTVPNGLLMIFIYILGNVGGMVEMVGKYINSDSVTAAGIFVSLISPFHTIFITMERVLLPTSGLVQELMRSGGGLSGSGALASPAMYVYIGIYMVGFVVLTIWKFSKRDII